MSKHTHGPWFIWQERAALEEGMTPDEITEELLEEETFEVMSGIPVGNVTRGQIRGCKSIVNVEADYFDENEKESREMALANARLIAAAPELLEALQEMVKQFTKTPSTIKDSEARGKAHDAITKATGGEA
jgi:hypothetical protein